MRQASLKAQGSKEEAAVHLQGKTKEEALHLQGKKKEEAVYQPSLAQRILERRSLGLDPMQQPSSKIQGLVRQGMAHRTCYMVNVAW